MERLGIKFILSRTASRQRAKRRNKRKCYILFTHILFIISVRAVSNGSIKVYVDKKSSSWCLGRQ